jgi:cytosine/adenosine deaminase-related metal-dependent hydrolase
MLSFRARWVLPIAAPPLDDGVVTVEAGRIAAVGPDRLGDQGDSEIDLGRVALLPGLVNAHTHLELSYLAGAVRPAARFPDWIRQVVARRREEPDGSAPHILGAARDAIAALRRSGTALVGDISNTLVTVPLLAEAALPAAVFYELLRFRAEDAEDACAAARARLAALPASPDVRVWLAPHAPYSVSPRLFQCLRRELDRMSPSRMSVHLAESAEELELLERGSGPWRALLEELGAWDPAWVAPGCGPVEYLDRMRVLDSRTIAVHGVNASRAGLERLAAHGATLVTCPRSNRYVGVGDPPVARFYESGVAVAIGTDSLASAPDLSVWGELAVMRRLAPDVHPRRLLASATLAGAEALGFGEAFGSIEPGKRADLIAVPVPSGVDDVEAYLVSGEVDPARIRWAADLVHTSAASAANEA